jgi:hypothetical protein
VGFGLPRPISPFLIPLVLTLPASAQNTPPVTFHKIILNPNFYSEGIHTGDLDKDGQLDIIAGPYWYRGPAFTEKHSFRAPRATPFPITGDSDCYAIFVFDFNQDDWPDILSFRKDGGAEAVWYENPKGELVAQGGNWKEHLAFSSVENESAALIDINGDGKPEIITNSKGYGGWVQPDWSNPTVLWKFHSVTTQQSWGQFTHGIGAGDVNGDGRLDLLFGTGWWEQPANVSELPWVWHPATFGGQANPSEGFGGAQMFAYDVDGDGDNDVISALQAHGWGLAWFENLGDGSNFTAHPIMGTASESTLYGLAFSQLHALTLADLDGDGLQDIVTGKRKGAHGIGLGADLNASAVLYGFRLTRSLGKSPSYLPFLIDSTAGVGTQVTAIDVNGDGSPDILTTRRDGTFVFLNQTPFSNSLEHSILTRPDRRTSYWQFSWPRLWNGRNVLGRR